MTTKEKERLREEIARLEIQLGEKRTRLSSMDNAEVRASSPYVIVEGDSDPANLSRLRSLIAEIGKRSRGGDSVQDIQEMRKG
ncbi:MAG: hypothetical protein KC931_26210 [Candidatus Omnitrophica bacterium]|nr:hypothetical protein [Candidatus Omnitrophota bacterium]MCA9414684.1 hypothetical protein [Candidatus Omnitrophota bacterium]MCA9425401.1 hypothetical protein [Candidatus Omnitrophota bacterium]MCA9429515.1 hypothetical protein [Candidatus Omnitrophota bacterium]MCA9435199.1 hypothetical protein [Candidatus Omnitrophota bacterium]